MPMNTPSTASSLLTPVCVFLSTSEVTTPLSRSLMSTTSVFQMNETFGIDMALSCMTFEARRLSRRWTTVTEVASFDR